MRPFLTEHSGNLNAMYSECCWPDCENRRYERLAVCRSHAVEAWAVIADEVQAMRDALRAGATPARPSKSVVYYALMKHGAIKIGYTNNLQARMDALRVPISAVLAAEPGGRVEERARHVQFADIRHGNLEDFSPDHDLMAHVAEVRERYGDPSVLLRVLRNT